MAITHRLENDLCIVTMQGELHFHGLQLAQEYVDPVLEESTFRGLIFNMARVGVMGSLGFGWFVKISKQLKKENIPFVLCCLQKNLHEQFVYTRLDKIFGLYESEAEAMAAIDDKA